MRALGVKGVAIALATILLGACGGDDAERVIDLDEVVHYFGPGGTTVWQVGVSRLDGSPPRQLTHLPYRIAHPAVSPDGRFVAFRYGARLWLYDVADDALRQVTWGPASDATPRWSPDSRVIVYSSNRNGIAATYDICLLHVTGGDPQCLTASDDFDDSGPDMSPDGTRIVWGRIGPDLYSDLWIMNADGTDQRLLLDHSEYDTTPQWSPDGRFILFRSFRYGPPCQFVLELATGQIRPVLGDSLDPVFMESATWTPDGGAVIIEVLNPNNRLAQVDLATGDAWFINSDTLAYSAWPSMRR